MAAAIDGTFGNNPRDSADGLERVNVFHNQFAANPTTELSLAINLPSDDSDPAARWHGPEKLSSCVARPAAAVALDTPSLAPLAGSTSACFRRRSSSNGKRSPR